MKVDLDLRLSFGRLVVHVGGLIAPFIYGDGHVRKERGVPVDWFQVNHLTVFGNRGLHRNRAGAGWRMRDLRIDARCEPAHNNFLVAAPQQPMITRHSNRTPNMEGNRR